jgi:hypothetical protein
VRTQAEYRACVLGLVGSTLLKQDQLPPYLPRRYASLSVEDKGLVIWPWHRYPHLVPHAHKCIRLALHDPPRTRATALLSLALLQFIEYSTMTSFQEDSEMALTVIKHIERSTFVSGAGADWYARCAILMWRVNRADLCECRSKILDEDYELCSACISIHIEGKAFLEATIENSVNWNGNYSINMARNQIINNNVNIIPIMKTALENILDKDKGKFSRRILGTSKNLVLSSSELSFPDIDLVSIIQSKAALLIFQEIVKSWGYVAENEGASPTLAVVPKDIYLPSGNDSSWLSSYMTAALDFLRVHEYYSELQFSELDSLHTYVRKAIVQRAPMVADGFKQLCGISSEEYLRAAWYSIQPISKSRIFEQEVAKLLQDIVYEIIKVPTHSWIHERYYIRYIDSLRRTRRSKEASSFLLEVVNSYKRTGRQLRAVQVYPLLDEVSTRYLFRNR